VVGLSGAMVEDTVQTSGAKKGAIIESLGQPCWQACCGVATMLGFAFEWFD